MISQLPTDIELHHAEARAMLDAWTSDGRRFDCIITDPPYGETSLKWDVWPEGWLDKAAKVMDQMWVFGSLRMFMEHRDEFLGSWEQVQDLVWEKHNGSNMLNDRFRRVHEQMLHLRRRGVKWEDIYHNPVYIPEAVARSVRRKSRPAHWGQIEKGAYKSEDGGPLLMRSVIYCKSSHRQGNHPTAKPQGIIAPVIEYSVPPHGTVLDLFTGGGAILATAHKLERSSVGVDFREAACTSVIEDFKQASLL